MSQKISNSLDRILTLEIVRVTERTAMAAARQRGHGDERAADQAAVVLFDHDSGRRLAE